MPKISVIIPCYNVEKYLEECLDSVLKQTFNDFEVICVEDCSTDNTKDILKKYVNNDKISILYNEVNRGLAVSRNIGLGYAKGDYVFFFDSDDTLNQNCLKSLYDEISKNPQCDVCCGAVQAYPDDKENEFCVRYAENINKWVKFTPFKNKKVTYENFYDFYSNFNCLACNKLYRRDFLEKNKLRFIDENCYHEDNGFWLKVLSCLPTITAIEQTTYLYRIKVNSISDEMDKNKKKHIQHLKKSLEDALDYAKKRNNNIFADFIYYEIYRLKKHKFSFIWLSYEKHLKMFQFTIFKIKLNPRKGKYTLKILGIPVFKWRKKNA